jgi:hypothetical protein
MTKNRSGDAPLAEREWSAESLVELLGPHPATALGLDLDAEDDASLGGWLVATVLLGGRTPEPLALEAWGRLAKEGLGTPTAIGEATPGAVEACLDGCRLPKSDSVAAVLTRVCRALVARYDGSIDRLAGESESLEDLAGRLSSLGAGFGRAAVFRFLTPLRDRWTPANDLPSSPAVCAAARDLGWMTEMQDEESAPASLARQLRNESGAADVQQPDPRDVEAALDRLGRAACLRGRRDRCPLGEHCTRASDEPSNDADA